MIRRLGRVLFVIGIIAAAIFTAMGATMLVNGVPDAAGGATVLFVVALMSALLGVAARFVMGWR